MKTVLITGCSRGLGLATVKRLLLEEYEVFAISRTITPNLKQLESQHANLCNFQVDLSEITEIDLFFSQILDAPIDILINNAGIFLDKTSNQSIADLNLDLFLTTVKVNLTAPLRLIQGVLPGMKKRGFGRIVNVSSGMGRFIELDKYSPFYRISKTALNSLTKIVADEVKDLDIVINAVCPGWVRTDMGGSDAVRSISQGVNSIMAAVYQKKEGFRGCLLRDGENFGW